MEIAIKELDSSNQGDFGLCDMSFTATSKLVLSADNGKIRYKVEGIPPYQKAYGPRLNDFAEYEHDPNKVIFLAYVDKELAGEVRVSKFWNRFALLDDFVVDPKFRRQGLGRALIQRCIAWAYEKGFPGLTLETQDINVPACKLYESCGFELHGFDTYLYKVTNLPEIALFWYLVF